jgi:hypothetical protein
MNADGTGQQNRTTAGTSDVNPDWQPLSTPSGQARGVTTSLAPVYRQCGTGANPVDSTHTAPGIGGGSPEGSCTPVTFIGNARLGPLGEGSAAITVVPGDLTTAADEADDTIKVSIRDVQTAGGADYNPDAGADLTLVQRLRITDSANCTPNPCAGPFTTRATLTDLDFSVPISCTATPGSAGATIGSTCSVSTSVDAQIAGAVKEGKYAVISLFRIRVNDSGPNGTRGDADDTLFLQQGIINP